MARQDTRAQISRSRLRAKYKVRVAAIFGDASEANVRKAYAQGAIQKHQFEALRTQVQR